MPHPRRFRFGVDLQAPFAGRSWADTFRESETLGYSTAFVPDHLNEGLGPIAALGRRLRSRPTSTSDRSSSRATSAIPPSWPASSRRSTCCRRAGSSSASEPGGGGSTTSSRGSRWADRVCASIA